MATSSPPKFAVVTGASTGIGFELARECVNNGFDVLIVAHGHFLRAFAGRWIGKNIADNPSLILEAGGVGTLSYEHHNLNEPAILLGGAFMSDVVEEAVEDAEGKK